MIRGPGWASGESGAGLSTHPSEARLLRCAERPQTLDHLSLRLSTTIKGPAERGALPDGIPDIEPRAAFDQEPYRRPVAREHGLVQRRRVGMGTFGVVADGILAGVKQQANNLRASMLRGQGERAMARFGVCRREQTGGIVHEA